MLVVEEVEDAGDVVDRPWLDRLGSHWEDDWDVAQGDTVDSQ
jgi:hypothetical protein